ncbi:hypothetical protein [Streptomyces sp. NPDC127197]|uniref:hypothetical protein n=1 Tax=Streptomyces sp. NPDC127197 TaxID=3345388 RepID=UPI0036399A59
MGAGAVGARAVGAAAPVLVRVAQVVLGGKDEEQGPPLSESGSAGVIVQWR